MPDPCSNQDRFDGRFLLCIACVALLTGFIPGTVESPSRSFVASSEFPFPGLDGPLNAAALSPDGRLFIGGGFNSISGVPADGLAVYENGEWSSEEFDGLPDINHVWDIRFDASGRTYISAEFEHYAPGIAVGVDGDWKLLSGPFTRRINFDVTPDGAIYAGECIGSNRGSFGIGVQYWNGETWRNTGTTSCVMEVHTDSRGRAFVGGASGFDNRTSVLENGVEIARSSRVSRITSSTGGEVFAYLNYRQPELGTIGRWNGQDWESLPGSAEHPPDHLAIDDEGRLYSRRSLSEDTALILEMWDGSEWTTIYDDSSTGEFTGSVTDIIPSEEYGLVIAGGIRHKTNGSLQSVLAYRDGSWESLIPVYGGPDGTVRAFEEHDGRLYVGGHFDRVGDQFLDGVAVYEDGDWSSIGGNSSFGGYFLAIEVAGADDVYLGGRMVSSGTGAHVMHWDGDDWSPLGSGVEGPPGFDGWPQVYDLALDGKGGVRVGGHFERAGGLISRRLAHWDGSTWNPMTLPYDDLGERTIVLDLETCPDGSLLVGLQARTDGSSVPVPVLRWDGNQWTVLGRFSGTGLDVSVMSIECTREHVVVGGSFSEIDGLPVRNIARLRNGRWSDLDGGINAPVRDMMTDIDGSLTMVGGFTEAGGKSTIGVAIWDGSWQAFHSDDPLDRQDVLRAISPDGEGGLFIGGQFRDVGSVPASNLIRYSRSAGSRLPLHPVTIRSARVFPNPLDGSGARLDVAVTETGTYSASVFDLLGRKRSTVFQDRRITTGTDYVELSTGNLPAGSYFIVLSNGQERRHIPFVVVD